MRHQQETFNNSEGVPQELFEYIREPEFKRFLHKLSSSQKVEGFKTLVFLSEYPEEGKTFLSSVLAFAYATILKQRVLIMDTISQARENSFHFGSVSNFGIGNRTDVSGGIDLFTTQNFKPATDKVDPDLPLDLQSIESLDSAEFLMGPFLGALRHSYDLIILDTCSLTKVGNTNFDPMILAQQVDKAILVLTERSMNKELLIDIKKRINDAKIPLMGSIINKH